MRELISCQLKLKLASLVRPSLVATTITEQICSDGLVRLYSAALVDEPSEQVSLKLIAQEDLSDLSQILALRSEAICLGQLSHVNIVECHEMGLIKPFEITQISRGGYFLAIEKVQGQSLGSLYPNGCDDLETFFDIASSLCSALDHVHSKCMRINNVNPSSIVIDRYSKTLKLVDFSGVRMLPTDDPSLEIAGSVKSYVHRTMMIESSITSKAQWREDLYGLGCVFYKLLMGYLPSRDYEFREDIPEYLVKVIDGLISPDLSKRYLSSLGVLIDIKEAKKNFRLGQQQMSLLGLKVSDSFGLELSQSDVEDVCRDMNTAYHHACFNASQTNITLISSNVSLKPIMNRLSSDWKREQAYVLYLEFAENSRQLSLWTLAESLNDYIVEVISLYPHLKNRFQANIKENLGFNAISLLGVVPALRSLLRFRNIKNQFEKAIFAHYATDFSEIKTLLAKLLFCIMPEDRPLVILCESIHQADPAILDIFKSILHEARSKRVFVVASSHKEYHDTSAAVDLSFFGEIKHIEVNPLSKDQLRQFVTEYVRFDGLFQQDLVELLYVKSQGDRKYLCDFLRGAIANKSLWFDDGKKAWCYSLSDLKTASFDVQDLDVSFFKLMSYDCIDRSIIEFAAFIGSRFPRDWLRFLDGVTAIQVLRALDRAVSDGLIIAERDPGDNHLFAPVYRFARRYIRDQIFSSIPKSKRVVWYQLITPKIAQCLHESIHPSVNLFLGNCVFALYRNFIFDSSVFDQKLCLKLANSLILASKILCDYSAFAKADQFLKLAQKILTFTSQSPSTDECLQRISENLGNVYLGKGEYQKAIIALEPLSDCSLGYNRQTTRWFKLACAKVFNSTIDRASDLNQILERLNLPQVSERIWTWWQSFTTMLMAVWLNAKSSKSLLTCAKMKKDARSFNESAHYNALDFYHLGKSLSIISDLKTAINFQIKAVKLAKKSSFSAHSVLRLIADQAIMLDRLGFHHAANKTQAFVLRESKTLNMPLIASYMVTNRIVFTDNNRLNLKSLDGPMPRFIAEFEGFNDKLLQAELLNFEVYRNLLLLDFDRQEHYFQYLSHRVSRHDRIFYRGLTMYLLGLFMQGQKEEIVKYVSYLKVKITRVGSLDAIYLEMLKAIIGLASGKAKISGQCYERILRLYGPVDVASINPHAHDFIIMFVLLFPPLYQSEFGLSVMNKAAYDMEYRRAFKAVRSRHYYKRSTLRLGRAIIDEYLNTRSKHSSYEKVVSQARAESNSLVASFALFLQLRNQYHLKGKLDSKNLKRLYTFVRKRRCRAIELLILRTFKFEHINRWADMPEVLPTNIRSKEPLNQLHIDSLALVKGSFDNELSANLAFQQNMGILANYYDFDTAEIIFDNSLSSLSTLRYKQEYSYFDREGFLACFKDLGSVALIKTCELSKFQSGAIELTKIQSPLAHGSNLEQTTFRHCYDSEQETRLISPLRSVDDGQKQNSAIIPIMYGKSRLALLLVHGIRMQNPGSAEEVSFELFRFGSFMAVWLGFKFGISASKQGLFARYQAQGAF
jgi:serine/threonine protein kinase